MMLGFLLAQLLIAEGGTISPMAYMIDGLSGGELIFSEVGSMKYDIAISMDGEQVSDWVMYPLRFNPAKSYIVFDPDERVLEVNSQMPYTANYTFAVYAISDSWEMTLTDQGDVDYYDVVRARILSHLDSGDFNSAYNSAMEIMYPGAMPFPGDLCSAFVIEAAEIGTIEAFDLTRDISWNLMGVDIYQIDNDSPEFLSALRVYAGLSDPQTAELILERIESNE